MKPVSTPISYRHDINGLRAWAVLAVLLFHFKVPGTHAGFIGVDVFFVISGYLMTAIIIKGLEANNFSLWKFYFSRIRRIVPALITLLAVLLILGWFWLPTHDYQILGTQAAYALTFLSNIDFWRSAGYFDAIAQEKWLLHTWSLGIEFQFYVLFPIYLLILWRIKPQLKTLVWGLVVAFVVSLMLSIIISSLKPSAAFYLLPTRGWELIAGGLVFIVGREKPNLQRFSKPMFWLGFSLWGVAAVGVDDHFAWPSGWALLPVLGTMLIILAQHTHAKLMHNSLAQWLGDRSYSLYLWHWPVVVALYFAGLQQDWLWVTAGFGLSVLLGHLSFHLVENPTRIYLTQANLSKQLVMLSVTAMVLAIAALSVKLFTFNGRLAVEIEEISQEVNNFDPRKIDCHLTNESESSPGCVYGAGELAATLIGDSHSTSTITSLETAANKHDASVQIYSNTGCPTIKGLRKVDSDSCFNFNNWLLAEDASPIKDSTVPIIILNRTSLYVWGANDDSAPTANAYFERPLKKIGEPDFLAEFKDSIIKTSCALADKRPVYLVRPIPEMGEHVPNTLARNIIFGRASEDIKISLAEYHQRHDFVWQAQDQAAQQCGVKILNPLPYLCDEEFCYGSRNSRPLYYDNNHLSEHGNKYLVPMFAQVFRDQQ